MWNWHGAVLPVLCGLVFAHFSGILPFCPLHCTQYEVCSFVKEQASQWNSIASHSSSTLDPSLFIFQSRIETLRNAFYFSRHKHILCFSPPNSSHTFIFLSLVFMTKIRNLGFCLFVLKNYKSEVCSPIFSQSLLKIKWFNSLKKNVDFWKSM